MSKCYATISRSERKPIATRRPRILEGKALLRYIRDNLTHTECETHPDCWEYMGTYSMSRSGCHYGTSSYKGKMVRMHKLSYCIMHGIDPLTFQLDLKQKVMSHKCDNSICWRPSHITVESAAANVNRAIESGNAPQLQPKQNRRKRRLVRSKK